MEDDITKLVDDIERKMEELNDLFVQATEKGLRFEVEPDAAKAAIGFNVRVHLDDPLNSVGDMYERLSPVLQAKFDELYAWRKKAKADEPE
ncbi:MAG: hypothetical protein ABSF52_08595 [Syntrophobacteraceae bacterium]|jgi:hypothetical protein